MMKELPAQVDGSQLPRIRTIFSGYRVTNTRGGVWANAGDVLVLRPLAEDEAVQFLEGMLEVVTLGRLTEGTLTWWLEDARALHFKAGNSVARIARATGLVPFLVGVFDKLLQQTAGSEVSELEIEATLKVFDEQLSDYAAQLSDTSWSGGLTGREVELLQMAVQITEEVSEDFDLERDFQECWSLIAAQSTIGTPFSDPADWSALKLLSEAGLLPARADVGVASSSQSLGRVSFDRSGTLVRLIKLLRPSSAT
jgi:hypothetical protein